MPCDIPAADRSSHVAGRTRSPWRSPHGATTVEYLVVAGVAVIIALAISLSMSTGMQQAAGYLVRCIQNGISGRLTCGQGAAGAPGGIQPPGGLRPGEGGGLVPVARPSGPRQGAPPDPTRLRDAFTRLLRSQSGGEGPETNFQDLMAETWARSVDPDGVARSEFYEQKGDAYYTRAMEQVRLGRQALQEGDLEGAESALRGAHKDFSLAGVAYRVGESDRAHLAEQGMYELKDYVYEGAKFASDVVSTVAPEPIDQAMTNLWRVTDYLVTSDLEGHGAAVVQLGTDLAVSAVLGRAFDALNNRTINQATSDAVQDAAPDAVDRLARTINDSPDFAGEVVDTVRGATRTVREEAADAAGTQLARGAGDAGLPGGPGRAGGGDAGGLGGAAGGGPAAGGPGGAGGAGGPGGVGGPGGPGSGAPGGAAGGGSPAAAGGTRPGTAGGSGVPDAAGGNAGGAGRATDGSPGGPVGAGAPPTGGTGGIGRGAGDAAGSSVGPGSGPGGPGGSGGGGGAVPPGGGGSPDVGGSAGGASTRGGGIPADPGTPGAPIRGPPGSIGRAAGDAAGDRGAAIAASNMVPAHADVFSDVAANRGEIIMVRPINGHAGGRIANDMSTKPMGIKGKSSEGLVPGTEFIAGLIPKDQRFSKLGSELQDLRAKQALDPGNPEIARSIAKLEADIKKFTDGNLKAIQDKQAITVMICGDGGCIEVLADPITRKPYTADYDLFAVGTPSSPDVSDIDVPTFKDHTGYITPRQEELIDEINDGVRGTGFGGGNVVHHGPENQFPKSPGLDFPITVFQPDRSVLSIRTEQDLKDYFNLKIGEGFSIEPNPAWGWTRDPSTGKWL